MSFGQQDWSRGCKSHKEVFRGRHLEKWLIVTCLITTCPPSFVPGSDTGVYPDIPPCVDWTSGLCSSYLSFIHLNYMKNCDLAVYYLLSLNWCWLPNFHRNTVHLLAATFLSTNITFVITAAAKQFIVVFTFHFTLHVKRLYNDCNLINHAACICLVTDEESIKNPLHIFPSTLLMAFKFWCEICINRTEIAAPPGWMSGFCATATVSVPRKTVKEEETEDSKKEMTRTQRREGLIDGEVVSEDSQTASNSQTPFQYLTASVCASTRKKQSEPGEGFVLTFTRHNINVRG